MRLFLIVLVFLLQTTSPHPDAKQKADSSYKNQPQSAPVTPAAPAGQSAGSADEHAPTHVPEQRNEYDPRYDCLYRAYLVATVIGVFGGIVGVGILGWQTFLLRENIESSTKAIAETTRSADAMEEISETIDKGNKAIMRGYLTVVIGGAAYQVRGVAGQDDTKFAAHPQLSNTGNTHARNVRIVKKAAIFPNPQPNGFVYPNLLIEDATPYATVAAHQAYTIATLVDDFVADNEIGRIKRGEGSVLHTWGIITYDDIFGDHHTTKFGQSLYWLPNDSVWGLFTTGANDAD